MSDLSTMTARGVPVRVIAAVTEKGVVRGIAHFTSIEEITAEVEKAVALEDAEWSTAEYRMPTYFKTLADFSGWDVPSGVYLYRWKDGTTDWRDPNNRFLSDEGELLWRPNGWTEGRSRV